MRLIFRALLVLLISTGLHAKVVASDKIEISEQQLANLEITTARPLLTETTPVFGAPATVVIPPSHEYLVSAPQSGRVANIKLAVGEIVSKDQLLAVLDSPNLLSLQRDFLNSTSELRLAAATLKRESSLLKEGVISKRKWLDTKNNYDRYYRAVKEAHQLLEIAGISETDIKALSRSGKMTSTLHIHAPAAGVVLERLVATGQWVDKLAPMFRIANLNTLWLEIHVPQELIAQINLNDKVTIDGSGVSARVILVGSSVDPANQTVLVRAAFDSQSVSVRPGQKVSVRIEKSVSPAKLRVPVVALIRKQDRTFVFVATEGGFEARPVETSGIEGMSATIRQGLTERDQVVIKGVAALKAAWLGLGGGD